jgi:hypothetical protein
MPLAAVWPVADPAEARIGSAAPRPRAEAGSPSAASTPKQSRRRITLPGKRACPPFSVFLGPFSVPLLLAAFRENPTSTKLRRYGKLVGR